jgi:hypothetical protein
VKWLGLSTEINHPRPEAGAATVRKERGKGSKVTDHD